MLVDAGLIARKDSPNGKRYARRGRGGEIDEAFGFNLAPLLARAEEIERLAARIQLDRERLRIAKERVSICRRDIAKLISAAELEDAPGDWAPLSVQFRSVIDSLPRQATLMQVETALRQLEDIRTAIVNQLENHVKAQNICANESQRERHIQDSDPESHFEIERSRNHGGHSTRHRSFWLGRRGSSVEYGAPTLCRRKPRATPRPGRRARGIRQTHQARDRRRMWKCPSSRERCERGCHGTSEPRLSV